MQFANFFFHKLCYFIPIYNEIHAMVVKCIFAIKFCGNITSILPESNINLKKRGEPMIFVSIYRYCKFHIKWEESISIYLKLE